MISIIVPIFNEEASLKGFITFIRKAIKGKNAELIFVDGGSTDNTVELCKDEEVQVFQSPQKGRAGQMNFGATKASGDIFYFLHVDSIPPVEFINDIKNAIGKGYDSGCYRLSFYPDHFLLRLYAWFTRFDIDLFRFGDQSLYVTREIFQKVKGFDESLAVMEDQQIVREIKKECEFLIMEGSVKTSSRKYSKVGVIKLQLIFSLILILYYLGISQNTILDFYSNQLK